MADTLSTIIASFNENADYDSEESVAKAKLFRTACRRLIALLPAQASRGGTGGSQSFGYRVDEIQNLLQQVEVWISMNDTSQSSVTHPDFSNARGY